MDDWTMADRLLALVRHGQSKWNLANRFTGSRDVELTAAGAEETRARPGAGGDGPELKVAAQ
jgi:2,3-bisphosphoglycerate-dependent phosphoglycerate mutase